jgi:hypothetical protein
MGDVGDRKWQVDTSLRVGTLIESLLEMEVLNSVEQQFKRSLKAQGEVGYVSGSLSGGMVSTRLHVRASTDEDARRIAARCTMHALNEAGRSLERQIRFGWTQFQEVHMLDE